MIDIENGYFRFSNKKIKSENAYISAFRIDSQKNIVDVKLHFPLLYGGTDGGWQFNSAWDKQFGLYVSETYFYVSVTTATGSRRATPEEERFYAENIAPVCDKTTNKSANMNLLNREGFTIFVLYLNHGKYGEHFGGVERIISPTGAILRETTIDSRSLATWPQQPRSKDTSFRLTT